MRVHKSRVGCALSESFRHIGDMREDMSMKYDTRFEQAGNYVLKAFYTATLPIVFCDVLMTAGRSDNPKGWHWSPVPDEKYPSV